MDDVNSVSKMLGLSPLHLACLTGDNEQVLKIIASQQTDPSFSIDAPVVTARPKPSHEMSWARHETSLMLAAMMGHLSTVESLVSHGAKISQQDSNGYTAAMFYAVGPASLQHRTFYLDKGLGREHSDAANSRIAITHLLIHGAYPRPAPLVLSKEGRHLVARRVVDSVDTGVKVSMQKTVGCLAIASEPAILFWAVSGYRPRPAPAGDRFVDNVKLSSIALHKLQYLLPRRLGFAFKKGQYDNGGKPALPEHAGRAVSSHVEVQLSTAYVLQLAEEISPGADVTLKDKLKALCDANIGAAKRSAIISLNSVPCRSCQLYLAAPGTYTRVIFDVDSNVGVAQIHREKSPHGNLQDVPYELWYDEDGQPEDIRRDENSSDVHGGMPLSSGPDVASKETVQQASSQRPQLARQQPTSRTQVQQDPLMQRILDSKIIVSIESDEGGYASDRAMREDTVLRVRHTSPTRRIYQDNTDDLTVHEDSYAENPTLGTDSPESVTGRSPSNLFAISGDSAAGQDRSHPGQYVLCHRSVPRDTSPSVVQTPSRVAYNSHFSVIGSDDDSSDYVLVNHEHAQGSSSTQRAQRHRVLETHISSKGPAARRQERYNRPSSTDSYVPPRERAAAQRSGLIVQSQSPSVATEPNPSSSSQAARNSSVPRSRRSMSAARSTKTRRRQLQGKIPQRAAAKKKKNVKPARRHARQGSTRRGDPGIAPPTKTFGGALDEFRFNK